MSEEQNPSASGEPGMEQSPLAKAIADEIPEPIRLFGYTDTHTPDNTPLKEQVPPKSEVIRVLSKDADSAGYTSVYLGNSKKDMESVRELVGVWETMQGLRNLSKTNQISQTMLATVEAEWRKLCDERYAGVPYNVMEERAQDVYRFLMTTSDDIMMRTKVVHEVGPNLTQVAPGVTVAEIVGQVPSQIDNGADIDEIMLRGGSKGNATPYNHAIKCRNSYLTFSISRLPKANASVLINNINATVRGYVRQVGGNTLTLAYLAGMKAVWEWLYPQITSCSVTGILDFKDLGRVIRVTDFPTICAGILASLDDDEIQMDVHCFNMACDWSSFEAIDPTLLVRNRPTAHTAEDWAILGNIWNGAKPLNLKDVLELIAKADYGLESKHVFNENQTIRLTIEPPSLVDAFLCLDQFANMVEPRIANARTTVTNQDELEQQIKVIISSLAGGEFIHWVSEFAMLPEPGTEGEPRIIRRSDPGLDQQKFNIGLVKNLERDDYLDDQLVRFVYNNVPYMTKTFIGMSNRVCPKCGKNAEEHNPQARNLGYTPIDIYMTFFTHTRFMLVKRAMEKQKTERVARS